MIFTNLEMRVATDSHLSRDSTALYASTLLDVNPAQQTRHSYGRNNQVSQQVNCNIVTVYNESEVTANNLPRFVPETYQYNSEDSYDPFRPNNDVLNAAKRPRPMKSCIGMWSGDTGTFENHQYQRSELHPAFVPFSHNIGGIRK